MQLSQIWVQLSHTISITADMQHGMSSSKRETPLTFPLHQLKTVKRLRRPETKSFFGKVSSVLAQSKKVLNFKKFLICVLLKS